MDAPTNSKFLDFSQLHLYFHLVKSFFTFFCIFYKKNTVKFFFSNLKNSDFWQKLSKSFFSHKYWHLLFQIKIVFSMPWEIFWGALHVCMLKIDDVEICSTTVSFLSFHKLEAASEKAMQLRRLIKSSNESLSENLKKKKFNKILGNSQNFSLKIAYLAWNLKILWKFSEFFFEKKSLF